LEAAVSSRWLKWVFAASILIIGTGLPLATDSESLLTTAILMFIIAALAMSWNIISGFAGQVNLGHAAFFGIGSLITRLLWLQEELPFALAFIAGGLAAALAAFILGYPGLRLKGIYFSIGTLALAEAIRITVGNLYPRVTALPGDALRSYDLTSRYYLAFAVLLLTVVVTYYLLHSKLGLGMLATREDEDAARSIGVNIFYHKLAAFVMSSGLAGLAGGSFAFFHVSYYPNLPFHPEWTFDALIVTFIGGIGTLGGPLLGALFFVLVRDVLAANLVDLHLLIFGVLFILVVLVFPGGLLEGFDLLRLRARSRFRSWQSAGDSVTR
jgi:branched-chain amino acid transport system permease protein